MNHPSASERDYWDRILKLAKDNGGSFTLDQIHEEFDLSSREMKKIKKLTERNPKAYDPADKYEFAKDAADAWAALISSEMQKEKTKLSPDLQRIEGLTELWFTARREILFVDFDDEEAVYAIELKCEALHQILLHIEQKGILHGWF
jgi:hypothetical protein